MRTPAVRDQYGILSASVERLRTLPERAFWNNRKRKPEDSPLPHATPQPSTSKSRSLSQNTCEEWGTSRLSHLEAITTNEIIMRKIHAHLSDRDKINLLCATNLIGLKCGTFTMTDIDQTKLCYDKLPADFLSLFKDYLDWNIITLFYDFTFDDLKEHRERINWCLLAKFRRLDNGFERLGYRCSVTYDNVQNASLIGRLTPTFVKYIDEDANFLCVGTNDSKLPYYFFDVANKIGFFAPCTRAMIIRCRCNTIEEIGEYIVDPRLYKKKCSGWDTLWGTPTPPWTAFYHLRVRIFSGFSRWRPHIHSFARKVRKQGVLWAMNPPIRRPLGLFTLRTNFPPDIVQEIKDNVEAGWPNYRHRW